MSLFVVAKIEDEEYAIGIEKVQTIEKILPITRVPQTENYVKGVINLRGEIIPVISLRLKLGLPEKEYDEDTRIVVLKDYDMAIGLIVDNANEVVEIREEDIDRLSFSEGEEEYSKFVSTVGKIKDRVLLILDLNKLLGVGM
ncbi:MAG: Chemotaxis signal transduction protein [Caldanaerobacter subterraneus]|uniref:Chemotaxis protein CheW n=1 Tax=Caldanaerobacter subterraneus TaxID=911092 RepID=A0A101E7T6_9THEO|nr:MULTISPECIES: chemotaxis protein CheW [Caldanaerobacter]KUK09855.1 MAG: Chemotaxis signal transduction protein [Caldanaerobacter subterraneus]MDI3518120.1 purine-binding chemotaxis protein CheW [Caldanaerobacter sp.]MDK2793550.1 purine-binding chemotaxis protein CheW [Caldanaerobacter sp.]HBT49398.1 chemotaxis protein CheW [Caldanaerobacter subterraneus]